MMKTGMVPKPHYDSRDYNEYVEEQKAKGLQRKYWRNLPKMWEEELRFRTGLEAALAEFVSPSRKPPPSR